jgi:hypothetical protein
MERLSSVRRLLLAIALAVLPISALPGCNSDGDPLKNNDGTPRKTPSEVLKEAREKAPPPPSKE